MRFGDRGEYGPPAARYALGRALFLFESLTVAPECVRDLFAIASTCDREGSAKSVDAWAARWRLSADWAVPLAAVVVERCRVNAAPQSAEAMARRLVVDLSAPPGRQLEEGHIVWPSDIIVRHADGTFGDTFTPPTFTLSPYRPHLEERSAARKRLRKEFDAALADYMHEMEAVAERVGLEAHPSSRSGGMLEHLCWAAVRHFGGLTFGEIGKRAHRSAKSVSDGIDDVAEKMGLGEIVRGDKNRG